MKFFDPNIGRTGRIVRAVMGQAFTEPPEVAPNEADKLTGESLGRRVAEAAARWKRGAA